MRDVGWETRDGKARLISLLSFNISLDPTNIPVNK